ncbi:carbohydrate kinase [Treponema primitia]|uniref:FGGY-family carbohydrate kinase n=1 Tax=Treponema primitia TaxID=88058 RepID=UPI00397EA80F
MDYIAVIDIGMTNKKVAVYDGNLVQLDTRYRNFAPKMIDGLETHDLEAMEDWFVDQLRDFAKKYAIKAIAISTHGATFVCVGKDGKPSLPCIYYTHEPGDDFHRQFYERFGSPVDLQARTGTPYFKAMINPGKGIFFAQNKYPQGFKNTVHLLMYPQYWGYRFTGKTGAESTYMGCHSYLWDPFGSCLSTVAEGLGVASLMPAKLNHSWDILGTITEDFARKTGLSRDVMVTMGIHDSNSSLLPHFAKKGETGFLLNSTGTWCVSMNPVKEYRFSPDELGKVVFFNISAFGKPVKTSIFQGGQEFETWSKVLMDIHKREDLPPYNKELYLRVLREKKAFLTPELTAGTGQFPQSKPRVVEDGRTYHFADFSTNLPACFKKYETGFALLRISLVMQSLTAFERIGLLPGVEVFTEGGFRKNEAYNILLSSALKNNSVFLTDIAEASAFGAAMIAKMALTGQGLSELSKDFEIEYQEVTKSDIPEIFSYRAAWLELV